MINVHTSVASLKVIVAFDTAPLAGIEKIPATPQGLAMNHRFLRDEAARFRAMADDADREATKLRLLVMAADYEKRAKLTDDLVQSNMANVDVPDLHVAEIDAVVGVQSTQNVGKEPRVKLKKNNVRGLKETTMIERHSILRRG